MTSVRWVVVRLVAAILVVVAASAGCVNAPPPERSTGGPGIPLDVPTGGSPVDFPVAGFDLCSPFTHPLFLKWAPISEGPPEPGPGSCRWRGEGVTVTLTDEIGVTLAEASHDPRYRPGYAGFEGNRYWVTATPESPPFAAHLFLATGPAQPRRLLHVHVQTEAERVPAPQPDQSYTANLLAEFVANCVDLRRSEASPATTSSVPRR